jgi:serine phosphatase RsbU (regulator of sigma subunit)
MKPEITGKDDTSSLLLRVAGWFWPELREMSWQRQLVGAVDVVVTLLSIPFAIIGIIWLIEATDWQVIQQNWLVLLLFGSLLVLFTRLNYFFIIEIRTDRYGSAEGSLDSMLQWSVAFIFGPSALWLTVIARLGNFIWTWRRFQSKSAHWSRLRSLIQEITVATLAYLLALQFFTWIGGTIPFAELSVQVMVPALLTLLVHFLLVLLIWAPYIAYSIWVQAVITQSRAMAPIVKFMLLALGLPLLAHPFSILVAGLYVEEGIIVDLFFILGLLMVAYLGRQLSWTAETSRQQSRMLEKLEALGRDIINAPPDASTLAALLTEHVPMMFPSGRVAVWITSQAFLYKNPADWRVEIEPIWHWASSKQNAHAFLANNDLPWGTPGGRHDPVVVAPILSVEDHQPIGCIYLELRSLAQPWGQRALQGLFPAVQSLADSIASALHQAELYAETLEYQAAMQELEFAGRIQASFLPNELPLLDGWELAVSYLPARETSGDFFDFILLPDGKVGILIADVADKGVGAALYMALSRTLIRTYALEFEASPDIIFFSANERILQDARANLFVTAFYGVLDQTDGTLTYSNAGHNSPLLLSQSNGGVIHALTPTGMPIGIDEDSTWTQATIQIEPGDVLILYTDGIPDTQDADGSFFKERRLIEVIQGQLDASAQDTQSAILGAVQEFAGVSAQFDDITLLVLKRHILTTKSLSNSDEQVFYD